MQHTVFFVFFLWSMRSASVKAEVWFLSKNTFFFIKKHVIAHRRDWLKLKFLHNQILYSSKCYITYFCLIIAFSIFANKLTTLYKKFCFIWICMHQTEPQKKRRNVITHKGMISIGDTTLNHCYTVPRNYRYDIISIIPWQYQGVSV